MNGTIFDTFDATTIDQPGIEPAVDWLWEGLLARGSITLMTSLWKAGKTTLVTGLLRVFDHPQPGFLGMPCLAGTRSLIVTEESRALWAIRNRAKPLGRGTEVLPRPFGGRPTFEQWNELIDHALRLRRQEKLDLLIVDPLASFLPGRCESDAGTLLEALQPLHHPRRKASAEGCSARGSGALLGFVDVIVELHRYGCLRSDSCRRHLVIQSRLQNAASKRSYEFAPATEEFTVIGDPDKLRFQDNWNIVAEMLKQRREAATHQELLIDWPADEPRPSPGVLYEWLKRAHAEKRIRREGQGIRNKPYRYRLENEDDQYKDRGELPPLRTWRT